MYSGHEVPETLVERLRCQKGNDKLDLSLCNITKVPLDAIWIYYGGRPHTMDLSYNSIRFISPKFAVEMIHISKLDLSRNQISKLPDNFGDLKELVYLDLHRNKLEALPLSMGEMTRLQYLRISENPFREPLKDFLGKADRDVSGVALAELVTSFLKEIAAAHVETPKSGSVSIASLTTSRSSRVHYRKRNLTTTDESSNSDIDSTNDINKNTILDEKPRWTSAANKIGKGLLIAALVFLIQSIVIAYIMDSSYLENLVKDKPFLHSIWTNFYKSVHEKAAVISDYIPRHPSLYLRGPAPSLTGKLFSYFKS